MGHESAARHLWVVHDPPVDNFAGFDAHLRVGNCCEGTIQDRGYVLAHFARDVPTFPACTPADVTGWLGKPTYSAWTRATYFFHLASYFAWAHAVGLTEVDPMAGMKRPRTPKGVPRPLTPEQVSAVLAAANPKMTAWLTLGLYAGLRSHEIAKIQGQDVQQDKLWVFGKGAKGAFVPTHPRIWDLAQSMPRQGWWFPSRVAGGHVSSMTISTLTTRLFSAQGITGSIHRTRHTFGTELLRAGVNIRVVQTLMRHESLTSTEVYLAVSNAECRDAISLLAA